MEVTNSSPANSTSGDIQNITDTNGSRELNYNFIATLPKELELKPNIPGNSEFMLQSNFNFTQLLTCAAKQSLNAGHRFGPYACKLSQKQPNSNCNWKVSFYFKFLKIFKTDTFFRTI